MASAITISIGSSFGVDLNIWVVNRKPLVIRRQSHLVRHHENLQSVHFCLVSDDCAIGLDRVS